MAEQSPWSAEEAKAYRNMMGTLKETAGWRWLVERMTDSLKAWEGELDTNLLVGEGAAKAARAQGAKMILKQIMNYPDETIKAADRIITGQVPAGPPKES